jgi:hypothetical protein
MPAADLGADRNLKEAHLRPRTRFQRMKIMRFINALKSLWILEENQLLTLRAIAEGINNQSELLNRKFDRLIAEVEKGLPKPYTYQPFWSGYPRIRSEDIRDARLYAERTDLIRALPIRPHSKIAEIGVWRAEFSKVLTTELKPQQFFAFDIFTGHLTDWNDIPGKQVFEGLTHRAYYEREMAPFSDMLTVVEGPNAQTLPDFADHSFDLVYVDAAHDFESVKTDTALAVEMVAESGFLVFNDYTVLDPGNSSRYGVVPVVNDLVVNHGWRIVGFALDLAMYCDVALQR